MKYFISLVFMFLAACGPDWDEVRNKCISKADGNWDKWCKCLAENEARFNQYSRESWRRNMEQCQIPRRPQLTPESPQINISPTIGGGFRGP